LYRNIIPDCLLGFWDLGFFGWDFRGLLEDVEGHLGRIFGGVLD